MTATPVSKEEVRLLALEIGVREAARRLGLNEDRVCKWSERGKWFNTPTHINSKQALVSSVSRSGDILLDELAENEKQTRLSLSRYARRAAVDSESATIRDAPAVHKVAQVAGIVHKWGNDSKTEQTFTLNVLNLNSIQLDNDNTDGSSGSSGSGTIDV